MQCQSPRGRSWVDKTMVAALALSKKVQSPTQCSCGIKWPLLIGFARRVVRNLFLYFMFARFDKWYGLRLLCLSCSMASYTHARFGMRPLFSVYRMPIDRVVATDCLVFHDSSVNIQHGQRACYVDVGDGQERFNVRNEGTFDRVRCSAAPLLAGASHRFKGFLLTFVNRRELKH